MAKELSRDDLPHEVHGIQELVDREGYVLYREDGEPRRDLKLATLSPCWLLRERNEEKNISIRENKAFIFYMT